VALSRAERRRWHEAAAANLAAWHTSSTRALGLRPRIDERWWTCPMPAPNIYFSAISVTPAPARRARAAMLEALGPHARDPATSLVSVCDTWDQLDLRTFGLHRRTSGSWFARPIAGDGAPAPTQDTPDRAAGERLRVEPVTDPDGLARFERMMVAGFGARPPIAPFDIHAPAILDDPAMHVLAGWVGDEQVACAMTYVTDVAGIYGVATVPAHRGRGHATAMTLAAAAVAADRVAVLQPTPEAERLYRRLGFEAIGAFSHWA
jgi:ribosomal protein S18 acetylase RimI-like enzyme